MKESTEVGRAPSLREEELDTWKEGLGQGPGAWAWELERSEVRPPRLRATFRAAGR